MYLEINLGDDSMSTVNSDIYDDFRHNGEQIIINWQLQKYDGYIEGTYDYTERIQFEYSGVSVISFYEKKKNDRFKRAEFLCNIIDRIGKEKYKIFKGYFEEYVSLKENFIVVDNKVYEPYINDKSRNYDLIRYIINIKMEDGKTLDGELESDKCETDLRYKSVCNKDKLIECLIYRVVEYYKTKNILPEEKYIINERTNKYNEAIQWFKENNILDLIEGR